MNVLDPRRLLTRPSIYAAFRALVSGPDAQRVVMTEYIRAAPRSKVLDIGCGPGVMAEALRDVEYTGIEPDARYVEEARRRLGTRGRILQGTAGTVALDDAGTYDLVLAIGVLHHLDDEQVQELVALAKGALRPGGRFVSIDCCYTSGQSRLARMVVGLDRGSHIRTPESFDRLVASAFSARTSVVRRDLLRVPYTHYISEATA